MQSREDDVCRHRSIPDGVQPWPNWLLIIDRFRHHRLLTEHNSANRTMNRQPRRFLRMLPQSFDQRMGKLITPKRGGCIVRLRSCCFPGSHYSRGNARASFYPFDRPRRATPHKDTRQLTARRHPAAEARKAHATYPSMSSPDCQYATAAVPSCRLIGGRRRPVPASNSGAGGIVERSVAPGHVIDLLFNREPNSLKVCFMPITNENHFPILQRMVHEQGSGAIISFSESSRANSATCRKHGRAKLRDIKEFSADVTIIKVPEPISMAIVF